eukprot:CAMPEP_0179478248 /NCGR_PEP_ID=MMETSP0799-20121207/56803_1 /TAXON_ID=46947 /ORGANISM="Geminigera cryophila, Strain CCMP2564" /LENGTH=73 /DNA_ID=CAMNT_0021289319 /DNA_START=17 /DNA_END=235 /DNA_ORIENTATION=+
MCRRTACIRVLGPQPAGLDSLGAGVQLGVGLDQLTGPNSPGAGVQLGVGLAQLKQDFGGSAWRMSFNSLDSCC